jgi:hypothetical protein
MMSDDQNSGRRPTLSLKSRKSETPVESTSAAAPVVKDDFTAADTRPVYTPKADSQLTAFVDAGDTSRKSFVLSEKPREAVRAPAPSPSRVKTKQDPLAETRTALRALDESAGSTPASAVVWQSPPAESRSSFAAAAMESSADAEEPGDNIGNRAEYTPPRRRHYSNRDRRRVNNNEESVIQSAQYGGNLETPGETPKVEHHDHDPSALELVIVFDTDAYADRDDGVHDESPYLGTSALGFFYG